jgi:hypothetical protein
VARRDGVNRTAAALHLDGGKLKRQMVAVGVRAPKVMPPAFVELVAPSAGPLECTIELEGCQGKIRIHCGDRIRHGAAALQRLRTRLRRRGAGQGRCG